MGNWFKAFVPGLRPSVGKGDRFRVVKAIQVRPLTHWHAPFTGGGRPGSLLPGEVVRVFSDTPALAFGVGCVVDPEERLRALEIEFVEEEDRAHPKYAGYSFVIDFNTLLESFERLG